jgi:hypothetical protein
MLENTEGTIKNGQSRETGNIRYTRQRKTKQKHNTIFVGHHYALTNTNNVNKTWSLLQTTGGNDEPHAFVCVRSGGVICLPGLSLIRMWENRS